MKKIITLLALTALLFGCDDKDDNSFNASIPETNVSFTPTAGGAKMNYFLTKNKDIFYIQAMYENYKGEQVKKLGSYADTEILLDGFIDEAKDIPVEISLIDRFGNQSDIMNMNFEVFKSGARALFDNLKVRTYWEGFQVEYDAPSEANGRIHIGYVGENPFTGDQDTLLLDTKIITEGLQVLNFKNFNDELDKTTVVVWTENFKGDIVYRTVSKDVPMAMIEQLSHENLTIEGPSYENEEECFGLKYLTDGDAKGYQRFADMHLQNDKYYTYFSYYEGSAPSEFIIDAKAEYVPANLRIHAPLNFGSFDHNIYFPRGIGELLPNHVEVYGSNDKENWENLGDNNTIAEYYQDPILLNRDRWYAAHKNFALLKKTKEAIDESDPCYMQVDFALSERKFRYYKLKIVDVFTFSGTQTDYNINALKRIVMNEIELRVKK